MYFYIPVQLEKVLYALNAEQHSSFLRQKLLFIYICMYIYIYEYIYIYIYISHSERHRSARILCVLFCVNKS